MYTDILYVAHMHHVHISIKVYMVGGRKCLAISYAIHIVSDEKLPPNLGPETDKPFCSMYVCMHACMYVCMYVYV